MAEVNLYKPGAEPSDIPETCTVDESELSQMLSSGWLAAPETPVTTPEVAEPAAEEPAVSEPEAEAGEAPAEEALAE